jgi:hypothetical protein
MRLFLVGYNRSMHRRPQVSIFWGGIAVALVLGLHLSTPLALTFREKANVLTAGLGFDFLTWTANAAWLKLQQAAMGMPSYLDAAERKQTVLDYLQVTHEVEDGENRLVVMYSDPAVVDKELATADLRAELEDLHRRQRRLAPLAEAVLQTQVSQILGEEGLTAKGQPLPEVLYHTSATPNLLVISRRESIGTEYSVPLLADMTVDRMEQLEASTDSELSVSSLVVPTGGIGAYPTMIMRTSDIHWLSNVIAHEWTHNYLYWHPLGFLYDRSPELRTMNETTADIVGTETGRRVLERFYPELAPPQGAVKPQPPVQAGTTPQPPPPAGFDFRREMHETRVHVDEMLVQGKIDEARAYMEQRRQLFWENGYAIRKLNQAYFAFYGSYADVPGGAAGEDPVGPAVRELRQSSRSLAEFVTRMESMTSFEDLQKAVAQAAN